MSRFIQFAFLAGLFTFNSCAIKNQIPTYWQNERNFNSEIYATTEANYYNADDQISIKIFNNDQYMDIILETNSTNTVRKIYNLGLSVWFDPESKLKNNYAINFPMPAESPYSEETFINYLTHFSLIEFNEELLDRFQVYEVVNTKKNETLSISTLQEEETYKVKLSSKKGVLFSYHLRVLMSEFYSENLSGDEIIGIGIASINEANEEYHSALSSKEYINKRMEKLKVGYNQTPFELTEWWTNFKITTKPK
ncbi:hypothetical protein [Labilibaculum antarcticum]|uniref:Uncharacterized protein n=1 Tax=Labilibaculum antarcticum TaxID=1717717 RepID=A0A1Y1CMF9_9BACT|nr:hypothetical protein [Labilibaculum antarcticum]BAX80451.1 hypothetical protein ALGA_2108 [Labilibaculum antarcticum]